MRHDLDDLARAVAAGELRLDDAVDLAATEVEERVLAAPGFELGAIPATLRDAVWDRLESAFGWGDGELLIIFGGTEDPARRDEFIAAQRERERRLNEEVAPALRAWVRPRRQAALAA